MHRIFALALSLTLVAALPAQAPAAKAQREARDILSEMISINTSVRRGGTTPLAQKLAARFRTAGVPDADIQLLGAEAKDQNLVVRIRSKGTAKPVLFLAHIDVVDAMRSDWSMEPYAVTEQDGWLYGRGTSDDKGPATTIVAAALALIRSGVTPERDIILAFTSGEEVGDESGAAWLIRLHKDLVNAEYVFNFDAGGPAIDQDVLRWIELQGSEKVYWTVTFTVKNAGGHSSLPRSDNAILRLATALKRLEAYPFPIHITDVARAELAARVPFVAAGEANAIREVLKKPLSLVAAESLAARTPSYNALLRTTCTPTMLSAGHAENALPALATATVNCRLIPGEYSADIMRMLKTIVADTAVVIAEVNPAKPSPPSPLLPERIALVKQAAIDTWGREIPISPVQETGATDGLYFRKAGIPVYGITGIPMPVNETRAHGNDERIPIKSFEEGVTFATALMRRVAGGK
jgi:acetylornithine deacetylase/succinyl-diaminopimelate desuccinylase-like protein